MKRFGFAALALCCWCGIASANEPPAIPAEAVEMMRRLPIQHNGRHKAFEAFARETVMRVTGSPRVDGQEPIRTVISMIAFPEQWQGKPLIDVPFRPLRQALGMDPKTSHVSQEELLATRALMRMMPAIVEKQQRSDKLTMQDEETLDVFDRFVTFTNLVEHRLELVPSSQADEPWQALSAAPEPVRQAWAAWITALRAGEPAAAIGATSTLVSALSRVNPRAYPPRWRIELEVLYHRAGPFRVARIAYLVAAVLLLLGITRRLADLRAGAAVFWVAVGLHAAGIMMRVLIGGRPPVSNFFETMLWLPFVGVVIALVLGQVYRVRHFSFSAAVLAAIMLWLSDYVPLDSSISPVVAVLHSNLWLTVHVLTVVASYGALALATILAHYYGALYLAKSPRRTMDAMDIFLYRAIQVGVVLLAAGIMLGAVWANASWGRYWGWDPKETWALITLLWFIAALHGRFAGWLQGLGVAMATISGFFLLLMTYYGVSFYLVGLHSYAGGHAKPLPVLLIVYLVAELAFLAVLGVTALKRRRLA